LSNQIANDSVNPFDHRFCRNLCLRADLDISHLPTRNKKAGFDYGNRRRHQFSECAIAPAAGPADGSVGQIYNALVRLHASSKLHRSIQSDQISKDGKNARSLRRLVCVARLAKIAT